MVNLNDVRIIRGDTIAMEAINGWKMYMDPRDRMHYTEIVTDRKSVV